MEDGSGEMQTAEEREVRHVKDPGLPSKEEYERHMVTHTPFRAWCPHCVRGEAVAKPHKMSTDKENMRINFPLYR